MQGKLVKIIPVSNHKLSYEFLNHNQGIYLVHLLSNGVRLNTQKLILID